ncbi:hypothetical protein PIB30_082171 [Stylosanthes scabra]|uniref:Protein FAR1-RELATED SEQUENCE n=1 Tax=Stylosanthes scabra TaxID=79078 RepID=A0ABU6VQQ3_9FABA|nr:hypothetical protein [Stylosanthes scabra]
MTIVYGTKKREREADAVDFIRDIHCLSNSSIEAQFEKGLHSSKVQGGSSTIQSQDELLHNFQAWHFRGCKIPMLGRERVENVDSRYVLERWSKKVKRKHTNIMSSYDEPVLDERTQRYDDALSCCFDACQEGSVSKELTTILHCGLDKIFKDFQEYKENEKDKANEKGKTIISHEDCSISDINELQSPEHVRSRGRPRKRLGSNLEKRIANEINKKNRNRT